MSFTYFFNDAADWFDITRNADLYAENANVANLNEYDYVIDISGALDSVFSTRTYQQNSANADLYDVTLTVNHSAVMNMTDASTMAKQASSLDAGINGPATTFGTRVLEVLALKIFGHARARAAIANDNDIVAGLASDLANHVQTVVDNHKNDIFNQYVQQDLVNLNANDVDTPVSFNFAADTLSFPSRIVGSLINPGRLSADLLNGPTDASGHQLVNGEYNIPVLIRLCQ